MLKGMMRNLFFLVIIGLGSAFFYLRCIACYNDVANAEYTQMAREIVEQSIKE